MKKQQGFTLIELLVTLAVAIVVVAVGIPVFSSMIANNRAAADSNALLTALQSARGEAVKRGVRVTVCAGNGTAAVPTPTQCSGNNDWRNGFLVVLNGAGNTGGGWPLNSSDILRVWERFGGNVDIVDHAGNTQVDFQPNGSNESGGVCLELKRNLAIGKQTQRYLEITTQGRSWVVRKDDKDLVGVVDGPCKGKI